MNIQFTLASRYLAGRKLRTALTTLAIVFGVLVIFGMNIMLPAFVQAFQANTLAASGQVDATITLKTSDAFDAAITDQVAAVEGVRAVSGYLNRTINVTPDYFDGDPSAPDPVSALSLVGIDLDQASAVHSYPIKDGRFLQDGDTTAAVISESLADAVGVRTGGSFHLPTASGEVTLTIAGLLPARTLPGNEEVLVTLPQAQSMLDMAGRVNTIEANFNTLDETRRAEIETAILERLGETYQIAALSANTELLNNMKLAQAIFNLLGVLALLMGGFIIFNTFRTVVAERRRDIGMLRALGSNRSTISGVIVTEGLVQGLLGTAVGLLLGYLLGAGLISLLSPMLKKFLNVGIGSPVVTPAVLIISVVIGVGVTLLAGLLPAIAASRVTPLEALRPTVGAFSFKRMAGIAFWAGVAMIALAAAALFSHSIGLVGLGGVLFVTGLILAAPALVNPIANAFSALAAALLIRDGTTQLAAGNLSRQPARAAITASTTLIGMAILIMAASMIASVSIGFGRVLHKSLGSDYILLPPSVAVWGTNIGSDQNLADQLRAIEGVEVVSSLRYAPSQVNGVAVAVMGVNPADYSQVSGLTFSKGDETAAYAALNASRSTIVNPVLASTAGVTVGDDIELLTPTGRQPYRVIAIGGDYLNSKITTAYISHANIGADFGRHEDVLLQLNVNPQADRQVVEGALKSALKAFPQFRLIDGQEYIEESMRLFEAAFAGLYALVIFLAVPSLIAMVNTLAIGVIERTREIGMLRAVGATRQQVRTIIVIEAIILAAIGTVFGVLSGLYLGYMGVEALQEAGFPMEYAFPSSGVLIALAAGIFFGVLAAIVPARQAARLQVVQALRYE